MVVLVFAPTRATAVTLSDPIVFVSRAIPDAGSIYWAVPGDQPGVGPHSRFRSAAPGRLMVRESDGTLRVLVDGALPTASSLHLIDVDAPDVSWDGTQIVFAGLPNGSHPQGPATNPNAWRLYRIAADGTDLVQITFDPAPRDLSRFGGAAGGLAAADDTDPCWLPDGRLVFSSTRWPSYAHYSGVRTSNLHVVNADGSGLRRITSERNGADRPRVDPLTGRIVFARWWRNHRFAWGTDDALPAPGGGWIRRDGLTSDRTDQLGGADYLWRNAWQLASIRPDGTGLALWGGGFRAEEANHAYGGSFDPAGDFVASYFPMFNMTEAGGFGGIRRFPRGAGRYTPLLGVTTLTLQYVHPASPTSYGIFVGSYATEPECLPDGRLLVSWAPDVAQDYGLAVTAADGSGRETLLDLPGTTELRARRLAARPLPPVLADQVTHVPGALPPPAAGPYDAEGTFVFDCANVYFNAPVDVDIVSAPPVGSAATLRFFIDHQRTSPGSFPELDWPILLDEVAVAPDGSVSKSDVPADVPLFEQIRGAGGVPRTGGPYADGAAHVTGMNYGRPGTTARCVGCHAGHTLIPVPSTAEAARWTNLAPGAALSVSSARDANYTAGLIDRRVQKGEMWRYWNSEPGRSSGEWADLVFPVPITVRVVRLYNPRFGGEAASTLQVQAAAVALFGPAGGPPLASGLAGPLAVSGSDVTFPDIPGVTRVRVTVDAVSGTFYGMTLAALAEIEVVGRAGAATSAVAERPAPDPGLLARAAPNPFRRTTRIAFDLPRPGRTRLDIHDAGGRLVATLLDADRDAGAQSLEWDAAAVPAGLYFWRVRQGSRSVGGKFVRLE